MEVKEKRNLKSQVEDFLVQGGDCPLDHAVARARSTTEPMQPLWRGDESFRLRNLMGEEDKGNGS